MTREEQIKELAAKTGYHACGITGVEPFEGYRRALQTLAARFPEAAANYQRMERRGSPLEMVPWARAIVVCVRRYGKYAIPESLARHIGRTYLCDRRIQDCPDTIMPGLMKKGLTDLGFRVRTGGVPSREAASRAGIVRIARNGFAYADGCGSWINIEAWMVNAELNPDSPALPAACPEGCRACMKSCPTNALVEPGVVNMKRCIAYLTYEAPDPIDPELWARMGPWIYGCDECQSCCPLNQGQWDRREPTPWLDAIADRLTPEALATMDQETYTHFIYPLFRYISPDNLARWHANARRAKG